MIGTRDLEVHVDKLEYIICIIASQVQARRLPNPTSLHR